MWFRVDDGFYRHRKVRKLGKDKVAATGLWSMAGSWAGDQLNDGFVPFEVLRDWDPDGVLTRRLIEVGLWEPAHLDGEDGVQFHDWTDWNRSRAQVLAERAKDAAKKARMRAGLAAKRRSARPGGTPKGKTRGTPGGSPALPDPGSLPSSGTPAAAAGGGAPAAASAEHVPSSTAETRARAREIAGLRPPPRRRGRHAAPGDRPLMTSIESPSSSAASVRPPRAADRQRAEQDRLAELDAVQVAAAGAGGLSPPSSSDMEPGQDQQKRATA